MTHIETQIAPEIASGTEIEIPLNKLKTSPKNARKVPHTQAAIEALAASIGAKKMLQKPVVEPERDADGTTTGHWLVTIGEGRRLALRLLAQRKQIRKTHPVLCMVVAYGEALAKRGGKVVDPRAAASHFNWLVMGEPVSSAMLLGDEAIPEPAALRRHAADAVRLPGGLRTLQLNSQMN